MVTKFLFRADGWRSAKLCSARPRTGRRWVRGGTWGDRLGKPAGSAPDATRNSATAFPRPSAVPAALVHRPSSFQALAPAGTADGRWTRAAGGETPHRAEPLWRHETWLWWARRQQLRTQLLPELLLRRGPTEPIRLARTG